MKAEKAWQISISLLSKEGAGMAEDRITRSGQIKVYLGKCFRIFSTEKQWKNFISTALIMAIISMVTGKDMFVSFSDTRNGSFAIICACIWIGIFNSIRSICRERDIVRREHRTGLNLASYMAAHWLYEAALCAAEGVVVTLIVRIMSFDHFIEKAVFLPPIIEIYISFFLIIFSSDALALLISSVVRTENTAMTVMPFALIVQLVMSGVIFELNGITKLISNLTISRWGMDAICASARINNMMEVGLGFVEALPEQDATRGNLLMLWLILLGFAVAYGVLATIALSFVDEG